MLYVRISLSTVQAPEEFVNHLNKYFNCLLSMQIYVGAPVQCLP